ncbi:hypothetical protein TVAG_015170 [Trichomonas vaginalis G3]|uniref:Uncharacterized protein n=1 Tax=Trichomonas vaginalis (strain ATCC PRA-98 / G3) TaxID=412133 RepID=A2G9C6_TRIV3|nr:hypothetical protein TVAGG3_0803820 [Trichomonas vaginalis G3]EAX86242.1 hypothetical protein TVAG_015170 [Trichomonas vaginalis G3]KAI5496706.1 hypothetical protein TVAGG3_0803820 [Trichomonas vaginalis G3]|eukprot:XP_001299172.1 hypothetical protein [Trichomonas vaginalis G3]
MNLDEDFESRGYKSLLAPIIMSTLCDSPTTEDTIVENIEKFNYDLYDSITSVANIDSLLRDGLLEVFEDNDLLDIPNAKHELIKAKQQAQKELEENTTTFNVNFHGFSVLSSKQFATRLITDLDLTHNFNLTLNVGKGKSNKEQKISQTKQQMEELLKSSRLRNYSGIDSINEGIIRIKSKQGPSDKITKRFIYDKEKGFGGILFNYDKSFFNVSEHPYRTRSMVENLIDAGSEVVYTSESTSMTPWVEYEFKLKKSLFELLSYDMFFLGDPDNLPTTWLFECLSSQKSYDGFQNYNDWVILDKKVNYGWEKNRKKANEQRYKDLNAWHRNFSIENRTLSNKYRIRMMGPNKKGENVLSFFKIDFYGIIREQK